MTRHSWLSISEVVEVTGWTNRTIQRQVRERKITTRAAAVKSRNGKPVLEYRAVDLPAEAQRKVFARDLAKAAEAAHLPAEPQQQALIPAPQTTLFSPSAAVPERERMLLASQDRELAQRRLDAISLLLDWRRGVKRGFTLLSGLTVATVNDLASYVGAQQQPPVSRATIFNWLKRYDDGGFAALADGVRRDKGQSRFFTQYPDAAEFVQDKFLNQRLSISLVHDALSREWNTLYNHGSKPPSYSTIRAFLESLPKPLTILALEGEEEFRNKTAPYLLPDYDSREPNELWVSDHVAHDVWVRNDRFSCERPNAAMRLWMTSFIDWRSRKVMGACWFPTPSSHTISSAMRVGIEQFGIPHTVLIDNGKDYQKFGKIGLSEEATGVLQRLGVSSEWSLPYHPQSKNIEAFHRTLHQRFDLLWAPFYCGTDSAHRPEDCDRALEIHNLYLKGKVPESPLPSASEFIGSAMQWLQQYNSEHKHSGRGMNGKTPDEVFGMGCPPDRRVIPDPNTLATLFWDRQSRVVSEGGCVELNKERYEPADVESVQALHLLIGRKIAVACDPANLGRAIALDQDGFVIGRLVAQQLIARGPVSHADIRNSMRMRAKLLRAYRGYLDRIGDRRFIAGDRTELEVLQSRATHALPPPEIVHATRGSSAVQSAPRYVGDVVDDLANEMLKAEGH